MEGRSWEGVVVIVPALPQARKAHEPIVAAEIGRAEGPAAPAVADRIDREGHILHGELAEQPTPGEPDPSGDEKANDARISGGNNSAHSGEG